MTDGGHATPDDRRPARKLDPDEQVARLKGTFVRYHKVSDALACMDAIYDAEPDPGKLGASNNCMLVYGETGSGKTALLHYWMRNHASYETPDGKVIPALFVEAPTKATQRALCEHILNVMGVPLGRNRTYAALLARVRYFLVEMKVRVLLLDEVQHMLSDRSTKLDQEAADTVKYILNSTTCGVVMAGLPASRSIFVKDDQLLRRRSGIFGLEPFTWDDKDSSAFLVEYLARFYRRMPFPLAERVDQRDLARRIHHASEGALGRAADLVFAAVALAVQRGAGALGVEHFAAALERQRDGFPDNWQNPFLVKDISKLDGKRTGQLANRNTGRFKGNRPVTESDILGG